MTHKELVDQVSANLFKQSGKIESEKSSSQLFLELSLISQELFHLKRTPEAEVQKSLLQTVNLTLWPSFLLVLK